MVEQVLFPTLNGGSSPTSPLQIYVRELTNIQTAWRFLSEHHYLGGTVCPIVIGYGAYYAGTLRGVLLFGPPVAPQLHLPMLHYNRDPDIYEIRRLAMTPDCPKNSESRFIAVCIRLFRRSYAVRALVTYADTAVGHVGTIYKASGFHYCGLTSPRSDLWGEDGRKWTSGMKRPLGGEWRPRSQKHLFVRVWSESPKSELKEAG